MQRFKWTLIATLSSVYLSSLHIGAFPEDSDLFGYLPFVSLAPFFSAVFYEPQLSLPLMQIFSLVTFGSSGCLVARHFNLDIQHGVAIGIWHGLLFPLFLVLGKGKSRNRMNLVWICACSWVALDYVVAYFFGIAVTLPIQLYRFPLFLQPISVFGAASVDALLIACNSLLGVQIVEFLGARNGKKSFLPTLALAFLLLSWFLASIHLRDSLGMRSTNMQVHVATVSPGYKFDGDVSDLIDMTRDAVRLGAEFVVWPEAYVRPPRTEVSCEEYVTENILPRLENLKSYIVVGCVQTLADSHCSKGNLAIIISPDHDILGTYGKQHAVWMIGEKSCMRNGYSVWPLRGFPDFNFSTLICYDTDFVDSPAIVSDMGASLILNPSEDWSAARGHFAASVFRAVENRVAIAKADWGWDSAIIQPDGTVAEFFTAPEMHRALLHANVTLYPQKAGNNMIRLNIFPVTCVVISASFLAHQLFKRRLNNGMFEQLFLFR